MAYQPLFDPSGVPVSRRGWLFAAYAVFLALLPFLFFAGVVGWFGKDG